MRNQLFLKVCQISWLSYGHSHGHSPVVIPSAFELPIKLFSFKMLKKIEFFTFIDIF